MNKQFKIFLTAFLTFIAFDFIWFGLINKNMYQYVVQNIQGSLINIRYPSAIITYLFMSLAITLLVEKKIITKKINSLKWGAISGLIIYGIFNGTNSSIFKGWNYKISLADTLWGTFLFTITSYIVTNFN